MKENLNVLAQSPAGLCAVTGAGSGLPEEERIPGVIFCLRNVGKPMQKGDGYALAPYYLVYVTDEGEVKYAHTHSKKILDLLKKHGLGRRYPDRDAVNRFNAATRKGKDMSLYRSLLEVAVNSIVGKSEEKGVESLFSRGGTHVTKDSFRGMEDFEVISYMIVTAD